MPRYLRPNITGATVFFTVNLADRKSNLLIHEVDALRDAVWATKAEHPFQIDAWVVLPNHMHAIWTLPAGDKDYGKRWGAIKARFSMHCRRAGFTPPLPVGRVNGGVNPALPRKGEVGLWQPRFWEHHIRDQADLDAHLRYCWWNPVEHGYVDRPKDWTWSSVHRDEGETLIGTRRGEPRPTNPSSGPR